jgi:hypothetical protein
MTGRQMMNDKADHISRIFLIADAFLRTKRRAERYKNQRYLIRLRTDGTVRIFQRRLMLISGKQRPDMSEGTAWGNVR